MDKKFICTPNVFTISNKKCYEIKHKGLLVFVKVDEKKDIVYLQTTVYSEESFIPYSIKNFITTFNLKALSKKNKGYLSLIEKKIDLVQILPKIDKIPLMTLIKLFSFMARSIAPMLKKIADQDLEFCSLS